MMHVYFLMYIFILFQLLEGSFLAQVSHETDGLIFQPMGVSELLHTVLVTVIDLSVAYCTSHCDRPFCCILY